MTSPAKSPVWHPFTQHALYDDFPTIVQAEGAYLHTNDGRRILDAIASWWVVTHGHCHPDIVRAIQTEAAKLNQIIFAAQTHPPAEQVAERLIALAPKGLSHVFFSVSSPPYESPWVYFVFRTGYFVFFSVICPINFCSPQPTSGCVTNTSVWHFFFPVRPHVDQTTRSISHLLRPSFLQQI